ncbi:MAG TPA: 3-oxoacid CoA-transferase subunit A [Stellaceae bacterium]|nr:3-oxoacid CoA-transferase subunit A [Stellaceae bacterium]
MIDKRVPSLVAAVAGIESGMTVLCAGFGNVGEPIELIEALVGLGARELTIVSNNAGTGERGIALLIREGRVKKVICSYPRSSDPHVFEAVYRAGRIELELVPQGTLSERIRAGGAGIGGFFTRVSAGTRVGEGKESRMIDGALHVLEPPIKADVALLRAERGDRWGNLVYRKSARNFNPVMAMAGKLTVAQVHEVVELGTLDPEAIHTPGIFVDRIVRVEQPA